MDRGKALFRPLFRSVASGWFGECQRHGGAGGGLEDFPPLAEVDEFGQGGRCSGELAFAGGPLPFRGPARIRKAPANANSPLRGMEHGAPIRLVGVAANGCSPVALFRSVDRPAFGRHRRMPIRRYGEWNMAR